MSLSMDPGHQPRMLVLPKDRSANARICTIAHPRTKAPCRYLLDPSRGIYEFTRITAPKAARKSWLVSSNKYEAWAGQHCGEQARCNQGNESKQRAASAVHTAGNGIVQEVKKLADSYIISKPETLVATPIDPLFLLLPALCAPSSTKANSKQLFLPSDDILDKLAEQSTAFEQIIGYQSIRSAFENRLQAICDSVDAGAERMYRMNDDKLVSELVSKAKVVVESGLPTSMEDMFIQRALDTPVTGITREESALSESQPNQRDTPASEASSLESQMSTATPASSAPESVATNLTTPDDDDAELKRLLRIRILLDYMFASYISGSVAETLNALLTSDRSPIDFKPLDERLERIAKVRAEALAARSLGNFSRKRNAYEDDDAAEARAEKKKKKEEEDKKKKLETRGVRDLKKVDVKGMKKMSDFFGKGAAAKKK